jgi:hypothetical protein
VTLADSYTQQRITIACDDAVTLMYLPLKTLSQSEKGFELTTQAISLALVYPFAKNFTFSGSVEVDDV